MINLGRLTGYVSTVIALSISLATGAFAIESSRALWPTWFKSDWAWTERGALERGGGQLSGILKAEITKKQPYGLLIGASTTDCGIDTDQLEKELVPNRQWLRMTGLGVTTCELELFARLAYESGLRPDILAICIDLRMLARSPDFTDVLIENFVDLSPRKLVDDLKKRNLKMALSDCETLICNGFNQLFWDRKQIRAKFNRLNASTRLELLTAFGQNALAVFPPVTPDKYEIWKPKKLDREHRQKTVEGTRAKGAFESGLYSVDKITYQSLEKMVKRGHEAGSQVVIMIMPENSEYRAQMPENAMRSFDQFVREKLSAQTPTIINMRHFAPDHDFLDAFHLNEAGRRRLTDYVAHELNRQSGVAILQPRASLTRDSRRNN